MLLSCGFDDNSSTSKVLQRIVFYRDSPNARQWNFSNNLLTSITLPDGSLAEEFIYDNQKRVIRDVKYTDGNIAETNNILYNPNGTIKSINGLEYDFDTATQTYSHSGTFSMSCQVNPDFLAINYTRTGTDTKDYHMPYANGNMISFEVWLSIKKSGSISDFTRATGKTASAIGLLPKLTSK